MKKIIYSFLIILVATGIRCTELNENTMGLMAPEGFFKTPEDVNAAINGAYAEWVTTQIEKEFFLALMLRSDMVDIGDRNTAGDRIALNDFKMDANNAMISQSWERLYQAISAANTAIKAARDISAEEVIKNELEGKARFLRGYTYFHLVRCFGAIPYMDQPVESAEVLDAVIRTPEDEVYNHIIDDLIFAKTHLPGNYVPEIRNIGTKGSAATALAEVYLTLKQFDKAAEEARFVISNANEFGYNLEANYQDLFNADLAGTLKEPIFTYELKNTLNSGAYNQADGMINLTRIRDIAPRSLSVNVPALKVYQSWDDRDYRKQVSFEDSVIINGIKTALVDANIRVARPHIAKYFRFPGPQEGGDDRSSDHRYSLYRYADVLLIAAEAIAEHEGATPEAIGYVNQIRARARFDGTSYSNFPLDIENGMSNQDFIEVVREERRLEFAFEFKRWYDIKRWEILEEAFTHSESYENHEVDPNRDYLFPLPQTEIDVTNFEQNPGY